MTELFTEDMTAFFESIINRIRNEIDKFSNDKILYSDIEELKSYYFEKNKLLPIQLLIDNFSYKMEEIIIEIQEGYRSSPDEIIKYDGYKVKYEVPFDGDTNLLYVKPSKYIMQMFRVNYVTSSNDSEYGNIGVSLNWKIDEMKRTEDTDFIKNKLIQHLKYYIEYINTINNDIIPYNERLPELIKSALDKRKKKADDFIEISKKFNIPITVNPNAPNTKPILLKKAEKPKPKMPSYKKPDKECFISNENYENIKNIINMTGFSMEKTVKTFEKLKEEEIRDFFYATFNTHYQCMTTGETFSKVGKTDISIQFDNKAAYIAECKIWHGEKLFKEAIEQLFSYTTWRDVKTSIIIFNKENKDFNNLLLTINEFFKKDELCRKADQIKQNEWQCEFYKEKDNTMIINVQIIVFDFFVKMKDL